MTNNKKKLPDYVSPFEISAYPSEWECYRNNFVISWNDEERAKYNYERMLAQVTRDYPPDRLTPKQRKARAKAEKKTSYDYPKMYWRWGTTIGQVAFWTAFGLAFGPTGGTAWLLFPFFAGFASTIVALILWADYAMDY